MLPSPIDARIVAPDGQRSPRVRSCAARRWHGSCCETIGAAQPAFPHAISDSVAARGALRAHPARPRRVRSFHRRARFATCQRCAGARERAASRQFAAGQRVLHDGPSPGAARGSGPRSFGLGDHGSGGERDARRSPARRRRPLGVDGARRREPHGDGALARAGRGRGSARAIALRRDARRLAPFGRSRALMGRWACAIPQAIARHRRARRTRRLRVPRADPHADPARWSCLAPRS
jgi:hypothetical protein